MLPGSEPRPWPCPLEATSEFRYYSAVRCFGRSTALPPGRGHYSLHPSWWQQVRRNSKVGVGRTEHFDVSVVPPWKITLRNPAPVTSTLLLPLILSWVRQVRALNGQTYMVGDRLRRSAMDGSTQRLCSRPLDFSSVLDSVLGEAGSRGHQAKSHGQGATNQTF